MSKTERVLLVENSSFLIKMMERQVQSGNFEIQSTSKPHQALEIVHNWGPSVTLLDLDLSQGAAFELIEGILSKSPSMRIICYSTADRESVWTKAKHLGAQYFMPKPIPKDELLDLLHQLFRADEGYSLSKSKNVLESPSTQPFEIHIKSCYVCGHDRVKFFAPKSDSYQESWENGLFPIYHPLGAFDSWDFLRTHVAVCPRCLFASGDIRDFAEPEDVKAFPYKIDAKKLLAIGMSTRRKMTGLPPEAEECTLFDSPYRNQDTVLKSLALAQKCGNGLILGDKLGTHAEIALLYLYSSALEDRMDLEKLRYAQSLFYDQLKVPRIHRDVIVMCFYFIIATHFAMNESIKANEMKEELEKFYLNVVPEDASDTERLWNSRLLYVWQNGVEPRERRTIQK